MPIKAIKLDDKISLNLILEGSSIYASAKSLDLDNTNVDKNTPNKFIPSSINSPRISLNVLGHRDNL
jgi:hypothetical protein